MKTSSQKALIYPRADSDLHVEEIEVYKPGPDELLVEVRAAGLNPGDWKVQTGLYPIIKEFPAVLGLDSAGIVKEVGEGVSNFSAGDRILYEGAYTNRNGTFQQFALVPADIAAKSLEEGATLLVAVATAAYGLYSTKPTGIGRGGAALIPAWEDAGRNKYAGQPILVIGGSSAIGQQALQFARLSCFSPIITTASPHNTSFLQSLGATHVIDRTAVLASAVKAITSEEITVIYDAVSGKDTQNIAYDILAPGGTLIIVMAPAIEENKVNSQKSVVIVFESLYDPNQKELGTSLCRILPRLLESGEIKPNRVEIVSNGLAGIPDALKRLKAGTVSGMKLVAQPWQTWNVYIYT